MSDTRQYEFKTLFSPLKITAQNIHMRPPANIGPKLNNTHSQLFKGAKNEIKWNKWYV